MQRSRAYAADVCFVWLCAQAEQTHTLVVTPKSGIRLGFARCPDGGGGGGLFVCLGRCVSVYYMRFAINHLPLCVDEDVYVCRVSGVLSV